MAIDTQKLRDGPYLRDGKETMRIMSEAADHINAQAAEIARLTTALRKVESVGGEATSGEGHARCKQIARAALASHQGEKHG